MSPVERISEILFGLIMVLTFTGSLSAAAAGREEIRGMLIAALGCNLAWGIIDAVFYLMTILAERRRHVLLAAALNRAGGEEEVRSVLSEIMPPALANAIGSEELMQLRDKITQISEPAKHPLLDGSDLRGALGVFLLVFLSTVPVVVPFIFMHDATRALRASNAVAVILLFSAGAALGRYAGHRPVLVGAGAMLIGLALVSLTIALGG